MRGAGDIWYLRPWIILIRILLTFVAKRIQPAGMEPYLYYGFLCGFSFDIFIWFLKATFHFIGAIKFQR